MYILKEQPITAVLSQEFYTYGFYVNRMKTNAWIEIKIKYRMKSQNFIKHEQKCLECELSHMCNLIVYIELAKQYD